MIGGRRPARSSGDHPSGEGRADTRSLGEEVAEGGRRPWAVPRTSDSDQLQARDELRATAGRGAGLTRKSPPGRGPGDGRN